MVKSINRKVPVVFITGWNLGPERSEVKKGGVDFVIRKPFEVKQIFKVVKEAMALRDQL